MGQLMSLLLTRWGASRVCVYMVNSDAHILYALKYVLLRAIAPEWLPRHHPALGLPLEKPHGQSSVDCPAICVQPWGQAPGAAPFMLLGA